MLWSLASSRPIWTCCVSKLSLPAISKISLSTLSQTSLYISLSTLPELSESDKTKRKILVFYQRWTLDYIDPDLKSSGLKMEIVFKRKITNELLTTYLPSFLLLLISYATTFFKPFYFEAQVTVNLSVMLVTTNLFIRWLIYAYVLAIRKSILLKCDGKTSSYLLYSFGRYLVNFWPTHTIYWGDN